MRKLDYTILELMESTAKNIKAQPVNLGGVSGPAGGAGGPPGGFIGYIPQTRVAYDTDEIASSGVTSSGTLLDNLNHIRNRIQILEAGTLVVDEIDGTPTVSGVNRITFSGGATLTNLGGGHIVVGITASGGGGGIPEAPVDSNVYGRRNAAWADLDTYYVPYAGATTNVDLGTYHLTTGDSNSLGNTSIKQGKNIHLGTNYSVNNYIGWGDGDITGPYLRMFEYYDDCFGVNVAGSTGAVIIAGWRSDYSNIEVIVGDADAYDHGNYLKINENGAEFNSDLNLPTGKKYNINGVPHAGVQLSSASPVIYTSNDTWTKPANLVYVIIEICGGGGGGGGCAGNATGASCGNGGGAGEYAKKKILDAALGVTETVTVGTGGTGGTAGNNTGGSGNTTSFGAHLTAVGGSGGNGNANNTTFPITGSVAGGTGGSGGSGGGIHVPGSDAIPGIVWSATGTSKPRGGGNPLAPYTTDTGTFSDDVAGAAGRGYGGGGSGGRSSSNATNRAGGDGAAGVVMIWEYVNG